MTATPKKIPQYCNQQCNQNTIYKTVVKLLFYVLVVYLHIYIYNYTYILRGILQLPWPTVLWETTKLCPWPVLLRRYPGRADFTTNEWRLWCLGQLNLQKILHFLWLFKCHMGFLWVFMVFLWVFMGWSEGRYLVDMLISNLISTFEFMWCLDGTKMYLYDPICMCYGISSLDIDYVSHVLKKNRRGMMIRVKKQRHPMKIPSERQRSPKQKPYWLKMLARYTIQYIGDYHRPWVLMESHGLSWIMIQVSWIIKQPMDWDCLQPLLKRLWIHDV